jgi:uncharacterized protein DUF262
MLAREIGKTVYKVSDFVTWQKSNLLVLSPYFQRRPVWPPGAKSYLIDTIIRGLPVPIIFLREQKTDLKSLEHKREVVDGQQRLRTVLGFVSPSVLPNYDAKRDHFQLKRTHNRDLADKDYDQLPSEVRQKILDYEFSVHVLPSSTDDREILRIFSRLNSTGYKLNAQELRNAAYFGEFKTSMFELAAEQLDRWRRWEIFSEDGIARMQEVELTSEFAQFMFQAIVGKSQSRLDRLYKIKDSKYAERPEVGRRFRAVMDTIDDLIGMRLRETIFCKRAPFYALFATVYHASYKIGSKLKKTKPITLPKGLGGNLLRAGQRIASGLAPEKTLQALARRTTHPESRKVVIAYLRKNCGLA